jgi:hypothetical protein
MKHIRPFLLLFFALAFSACATMNVTKVPANRLSAGKDGLIYILPKVEYDILVTVKKTELRAGEYFVKSKEEELYTNLDGLINLVTDQNKSYYSIAEIELIPRILPDEDQVYHVQTLGRNSLISSKNYFFELTPHGYMKSGDITSSDYSSEFVTSAVKTTAQIMGKLSVPLFASTQNYVYEAPKPTKAGIMDHIIKEINRIRIAKKELLIENNNQYSSAEMDKILKELEKEEAKLIPLIAGTKTETFEKRIYNYKPQLGKTLLFYFSKEKGLNAEPIIENQVEVELESHIRFAGSSRLRSSGTKTKGLHYRIPATVNFKIQSPRAIYLNKTEVIPQLGTTAFLPSRIGLFKNKLNYRLDTKTGALILFEGNSEGAGQENVMRVSDEILRLADPQGRSLEDLEMEIKRLELEQKRKELQESIIQ